MAGPLTNVDLGQLVKDFGSNLWSEIKTVTAAIFSFLGSFVGSINASVDDINQIIDDWNEIKEGIQAEIQKIKDFQFHPKLKSRVINVPIAIDQMHGFAEDLRSFFTEKIQSLIDPIHDLVQEIKADAASIQSTGDKPSALARAATISHGIETSIHQIRQAMDAAKDLSDLANKITDNLSGLDPLFLQQKNPRQKAKTLGLIRIGKLHH